MSGARVAGLAELLAEHGDGAYREVLRVPALSLGLLTAVTGHHDVQSPHDVDEICGSSWSSRHPDRADLAWAEADMVAGLRWAPMPSTRPAAAGGRRVPPWFRPLRPPSSTG